MTAHHRALAALATAGLLAGCSAKLPTNSSTSTSGSPPGASGRAPNGPRYSTASADRVQAMPPPDSCHYRGTGLFAQPDPRCAPGALNPAVTQANLDQTICRSGHTGSVRPPENVTEPEKRALMAAYGNTAPLQTVEMDHIVSLGLGGAANDVANFYPEPDYPGVSPASYYQNPKDRLEDRLHDLVCAASCR